MPVVRAQTIRAVSSLSFEDIGEVTLPKDYDHPYCLRRFFYRNPTAFLFKDGSISDKNFPRPSHRMKAGGGYRVRLASVLKTISYEEALRLLQEEGTVFTGAQGLVTVWEQLHEIIPRPRSIFSLDQPASLPIHRAADPGQDLRGLPVLGAYCGEADLTLLTTGVPIIPGKRILCMTQIS
jgi:hypothetical protein